MVNQNNGSLPPLNKIIDKSVQSGDVVQGIGSGGLIMWMGQVSDSFVKFNTPPYKQRDRQLKEFAPSEPLFASALGIVCSRNASQDWALTGSKNLVQRTQEMLMEADLGNGWESLMVKLSIDFYTQDQGAFLEIIRMQANSDTSPVIGVSTLESARMFPTGERETPWMYLDTKGAYHKLPWYNVIHFRETPWPTIYPIQICALSRILMMCQTLKNVTIYNEEKTGGRFVRAIHLLKGITHNEVDDAIHRAMTDGDNQQLMRYLQPVYVNSIDPSADVGHDTIELASVPDHFEMDTSLKWYIALLAMGFQTDYQEFAPLPGGNLGTSHQSEVLHLKTRGKGPAYFRKLITRAMNFRKIMPPGVIFGFDEQDIQEETQRAELRKTRAEEREIRIRSTEITPQEARQLALDAGDMPEEMFTASQQPDITPQIGENVTPVNRNLPPMKTNQQNQSTKDWPPTEDFMMILNGSYQSLVKKLREQE